MNFPQQVTTRSDDLSSREILRSIPSLADELADVEEELDTLEALVPAEIENFSSQSAEKETGIESGAATPGEQSGGDTTAEMEVPKRTRRVLASFSSSETDKVQDVTIGTWFFSQIKQIVVAVTY